MKFKVLSAFQIFKEQENNFSKLNTLIRFSLFRFEKEKSGGAKQDRTADLLRARQALSQLSYSPTMMFHDATLNWELKWWV